MRYVKGAIFYFLCSLGLIYYGIITTARSEWWQCFTKHINRLLVFSLFWPCAQLVWIFFSVFFAIIRRIHMYGMDMNYYPQLVWPELFRLVHASFFFLQKSNYYWFWLVRTLAFLSYEGRFPFAPSKNVFEPMYSHTIIDVEYLNIGWIVDSEINSPIIDEIDVIVLFPFNFLETIDVKA